MVFIMICRKCCLFLLLKTALQKIDVILPDCYSYSNIYLNPLIIISILLIIYHKCHCVNIVVIPTIWLQYHYLRYLVKNAVILYFVHIAQPCF